MSDLLQGERPIKQHPVLTVQRVLYSVVVLPVVLVFLILATVFRELFVGGDSLLDLIGRLRLRGSKGLVQQSASRTAVMVAIVRYIGTFEGWSNDVLARHFIPYELAKAIELTNLFKPSYPVTLKRIGLLMTRTLAGDRLITNSKPKQVVLLGAGLDTRAHRLHVDADCAFYEVDIVTTQTMKRRVAEQHPNEFTNKQVRYVAVDFSKEKFTEKLVSSSDFDISNPNTVILFEGVSMYLPWGALEETLRLITSQFAPGTILGMDCIEDFFLSDAAQTEQNKQPRVLRMLTKLVSAVGEPFQWGVPPGKTPQDMFLPLGFELVAEITAKDVEKDFLSVKPGARPFTSVPKFWHYLVLKVKS